MSIPIHLQQFKAAGIYRVVFDKSTIVNYDTELLRLVVGYSEQGPFNIPVYVKDPQTFTALFGGINKKLERRGIFFHRLALQMLGTGPILVLNLKKFNNETVGAVTINSDFNPDFEPVETVKLSVEDIYDTTRFWELNAEKLNNLTSVEGANLDQYINIATTNTKKTSASIFIRKASGTKVSAYNITVNDWYSDNPALMPEFLEPYKNNLISDYFAEIYAFSGEFTAKQVLGSDTLKNYFNVITDEENPDIKTLVLKPYIINAFGDAVDTLDMMYNDLTSNPLGHYVGCLIPEFKTKNNTYASLDIMFNSDQDVHNMMMSFNTDMLYEEGTANIDISGRLHIPQLDDNGEVSNKISSSAKTVTLDALFDGTAKTTVLGNHNAPVITDTLHLSTTATKTVDGKLQAVIPFTPGNNNIRGTLYVQSVAENGDTVDVTLQQVADTVVPEDNPDATPEAIKVIIKHNVADLKGKYGDDFDIKNYIAEKYGVVFDPESEGYDLKKDSDNMEGFGTGFSGKAFDAATPLAGPERVITSIVFIEPTDDDTQYTDNDLNLKVSFMDVQVKVESTTPTELESRKSVYGTSVSFLDHDESAWNWEETFEVIDGIRQPALVCHTYYDRTLVQLLQKGDCLLAKDGIVDYNENGKEDDEDFYHDAVYVTETGTKYDENGEFVAHYVLLTGEPFEYKDNYLVRIDAALNQEIGEMTPIYLEGYVYENSRPVGTGMWAKLQWQKFILSALEEYKGLRTGLLNKSEIDYRYVVDTFESFPDESIKKELAYLCKQKQSAFCIANFPAVQTFTKCPYASFTDNKRVFNVEYVVKGCNKKKASSISFSLPDDVQGGSFVAFYSPLKFTDGYLDSIIPSAGLVSNLFIEKYMTRQPYYIVAGPNYGRIAASGLVGPDYKYSSDELQIIEPFGVNCMVYRPNFGTFINANQTAKQTPLSALSKVHVRELVIYLQDEIEKVLQAYQWEFNNPRTREAILLRANDICSRVMSNGGLQAYLNIMDESNNTPEIIDNEMAVLSTHIEPGMGCGKMVHELTLYRTGRMLSTINEGV